MHTYRSSQCGRKMELQIQRPLVTIHRCEGDTQRLQYLHRDIEECEGRRPHESYELRSSGCDKRSG